MHFICECGQDTELGFQDDDRFIVCERCDRIWSVPLGYKGTVVGLRAKPVVKPVVSQKPMPMILWCPACCKRHIDKGEFVTKPHHTHACQHCGMVWRQSIEPTVGVQFLPGFKDDVDAWL